MGPRTTLVIISALLALDRALKLVAQHGLTEGWSFFDFYPRLTLHRNYGIAFDLPAPQLVITTITGVVIILLMIWLIRVWHTQPSATSALLIIMAGAASNLFDRVVFGFVVDTIEVIPRSIWNIADIMIVVGLFMLVRSYGKSDVRGALRS